MLFKILTVATLAITLNGCGGGGDTAADTASAAILGLSVPAGADLITDNTRSASGLTSSVASGFASAYSDADTDYSKATARTKIHLGYDSPSRPLQTVDTILCILNKTAQSTIVNGEYLAVLDVNLCNNSGSNEPFMANMTVDTSRASNSSDQISKVMYEVENSNVIKATRVDAVVKTEPTEASPYGNMVLTYAAHEPSPVYIDSGSLKISTIGNNSNIEYVNEVDRRNQCDSCDYDTHQHPTMSQITLFMQIHKPHLMVHWGWLKLAMLIVQIQVKNYHTC